MATAGVLAGPLESRCVSAANADLPKRLRDVNTTDIKDAIRLGCRTMQSVFNEDDPHRVAFMGASMRPPRLSFSSYHSESHIPGRHGFTACYHDAERILRGHLLPGQLRDVSWAVEAANPQNKDDRRAVPDRLRGAFGFPAPYGHVAADTARPHVGFNLDIVGGTVGSLCEAYREVARYEHGIHRVNLLFDHETDAAVVQSPYTHDALTIRLKKPGSLFVRVPPWVERERVQIAGALNPPRWTEDCLFLGNPAVGKPVRVSFPLKDEEITLGAPHPRPLRVRLRGDAVTGMDNRGARLTFFPPFETPVDR